MHTIDFSKHLKIKQIFPPDSGSFDNNPLQVKRHEFASAIGSFRPAAPGIQKVLQDTDS